MTQSFRWLAAFALLVAFGAGAVRAEEEQEEVSPPPHTSVERLPAPHLVGATVIPHAASCCQGCGSACACCSQCCARTTPADNTQYVVTTKIVHASPDGDCDEIMSPKVTVFGGQIANVLVQDVQTPAGEHDDVALMVQVINQGKDIHLALGMKHHTSISLGDGSEGAWAEETRTVCNVTLGKMKRLVFTKNANGSDASWAEVTVTTIAPEDDAEDSPLDCVNEALGDLIDTVADVATSLFGDDAEVEQAEFLTPAAAAPRDYPVPATAPCPACKQCVAVEAVKKSVLHMHIDASQGRKRVEFTSGDKGWKGTADRITLRDGSLILEGHVHMASSDGADQITSEKLSLKADLEIQIGD